MAQTDLPPVPFKTPMSDGSGGLSQPWLKWFVALMQRVGGNTAPTNNDLLLNPMSTIGDTVYGGASGVATRLPGNTSATKKFLAQTGTGTASAAPQWATLSASDVPTLNQNTTGTAANITATSNATLTTLSSLTLPGSQVTGNISGNAATATSATTATTATKPASGSAHGAVTLDSSGNFTTVAPSTSGNVLTSNGTDWVSQVPGSGLTKSQVIVTAGNGHGSTNTCIRRFSTTQENVGTAITYADSATLGGSFTINEAGVYAIHWYDRASSNCRIGISLNTTGGATVIQSISASERLDYVDGSTGNNTAASATAYFQVNDVIRAHDAGTCDATTAATSRFSIVKVSG